MSREAEHLLLREIRAVRERVEQNPITSDLMPSYNLMQVGAFVEQTHIAIEKGLKWAIVKAGGDPGNRHSLQALSEKLSALDNGRPFLDYLREAFIAVRKFYRIDISHPELKHIKSLDSYLNKVGGKKIYDEARYATLDAISKGAHSSGSLRYVFPQAHIELLRTLECVARYESWQDDPNRKENIVARVEREVRDQIIESASRHVAIYGSEILDDFKRWDGGADCYVNALEVAVRSNFKIGSFGAMQKVLSNAFEELSESKDPAVKYRMDTFHYMERDSQLPIEGIDLERSIRTINGSQDLLEVCSPSEEHIGFMQRNFDGSWSVDSSITASLRFTAWERNDAVWLLLRLAIWTCDSVINGVARQLMLIGQSYGAIGLRTSWDAETGDYLAKEDFDLKFWDSTHGLKRGDRIALNVLESAEFRESRSWVRSYRIGRIILGDVTEVKGHEVKVLAEGPVHTTLTLDDYLSKHDDPDFPITVR